MMTNDKTLQIVIQVRESTLSWIRDIMQQVEKDDCVPGSSICGDFFEGNMDLFEALERVAKQFGIGDDDEEADDDGE